MWLQPVHNQPIHNPSYLVPALISPRQGYTTEEIVGKLKKLGADNVQFPADGFISAEIATDSLKNLESVAIVQIKHRHQMNNRP